MVNTDVLNLFRKEDRYQLLTKGQWGLEKESLRVDGKGDSH